MHKMQFSSFFHLWKLNYTLHKITQFFTCLFLSLSTSPCHRKFKKGECVGGRGQTAPYTVKWIKEIQKGEGKEIVTLTTRNSLVTFGSIFLSVMGMEARMVLWAGLKAVLPCMTYLYGISFLNSKELASKLIAWTIGTWHFCRSKVIA